ncbi:4643_t:CDS:2, partial [Dentiscutata erythropus]
MIMIKKIFKRWFGEIPDDTYDADMINSRIFIENYGHPNDERLYNELNGHFFVITDSSIQEIIDGDYEFFVGNNDIIPERRAHLADLFM